MKCRYTYAAGAGLLLTLACGPRVEIGHGANGGTDTGGRGSSGSRTVGSAGSDQTMDGGASGSSALPSGGSTVVGEVPKDDGPQKEVAKVDLLLAVDNSISMTEKQQLLAKTVPELVKRLVSPHCVSSTGAVVSEPGSPAARCPTGSQREFEPLTDLHVGVITSSLGSHGANGVHDVCVGATDDDHAHLLPFVRPDLDSYDGKGYLNWDPLGLATPPGESDVQAFADSLATMITSAGEHGCGLEAQLESVYRFLVDPNPPQSIERPEGSTLAQPVGTDSELLKERADFLRPDSSVVVLMLTDENDCSIQDEGYGYLTATTRPMYRSTSVCATNPNDACCQSCAETAPHAGCAPFAEDSECKQGQTLPMADDSLNLRCLNQKARFGFDLLYPTARYVSGFGGGDVPDRDGNLVPNPLFRQGGTVRDTSLFTLSLVAGVPWQDLATTASLSTSTLEYLTPEALQSSKRWPLLLGDPATNTPPLDPFMLESTEERSGENPITKDSIAPSTSTDPLANAINGHEQVNDKNDLQYACTFVLPEPLTCDDNARKMDVGCDCYQDDLQANRSVCNPPAGGAATIQQTYGKAYPATRELTVAQGLGRRSVLGSICARNTTDDTRTDYGYRPLFGALGRRIAATLVKP